MAGGSCLFCTPYPKPAGYHKWSTLSFTFFSLFGEVSSSYAFQITILWRIEPLPSGDSANNDSFWATAR
jgi:hypothetical protein